MDHKRSKRDVEWARAHVVDLESRARFTTDPARDGERLLAAHRHLRLDNDHADARATAERIVTDSVSRGSEALAGRPVTSYPPAVDNPVDVVTQMSFIPSWGQPCG